MKLGRNGRPLHREPQGGAVRRRAPARGDDRARATLQYHWSQRGSRKPSDWQSTRAAPVEIGGLEPCLPYFGLAADG